MNRYLKLFVTIQIILDIFFNLLNNEPTRKRTNDLVVMVGNWHERKESGVDMKEGAIKVSVLKAVLFLWRGLKPPDKLVTFLTIYKWKICARFERYNHDW